MTSTTDTTRRLAHEYANDPSPEQALLLYKALLRSLGEGTLVSVVPDLGACHIERIRPYMDTLRLNLVFLLEEEIADRLMRQIRVSGRLDLMLWPESFWEVSAGLKGTP